ncbi:MAG: hypothetical protein MJZ35_01970 [Bacteroidaceae bacterium]|nr:hypothetical protein [Bacteroidaceae bacterium]
MAYGIAYYKEESERKESSKENKEKEETLSLYTRKALKYPFATSSVNEVQPYWAGVGSRNVGI